MTTGGDEPESITDGEAAAFLDLLFPAGPVARDVIESLRSDGWPDADSEIDCAWFVGWALWAVISDNNDLVLPDGRVVTFGTWRGAAGVIADWLNARDPEARFDYMDFYMAGAAGRGPDFAADRWLAAARLVFRRLRDVGATWIDGSSYDAIRAAHDAVRAESR